MPETKKCEYGRKSVQPASLGDLYLIDSVSGEYIRPDGELTKDLISTMFFHNTGEAEAFAAANGYEIEGEPPD